MKTTNRSRGLDILRSTAIILVFMAHYTLLTRQSFFGPLGHMGGIGVDLFFVLSGYLIGHQIFSALKNENFSLKIFYVRRLLRTLPNYFFVLGLYLLFPFFREQPFTVPLWNFFTFTQNFFDITPGAFSHAWSLCIEEQFYLILPLIALLLVRKTTVRLGWLIILTILIGEIIIRGSIWLLYLRHAGDVAQIYIKLIYAPTFSRLDSLVLGVSLALLKNYQSKLWARITTNGNLLLVVGIVGYCFVAYIFQTRSPKEFFPTVLNYSFLALSSTTLVLSALCQNSFLNKIRIPGAKTLAVWSFAIYLTHKSLIHITQTLLSWWPLNNSALIMLPSAILTSLAGGWLLYTCIEKPFLNLRDKIGKLNVTYKPIIIN